MAADSASGIPLELFGLVTPLPADGGPVSGELIEYEAHAAGPAAVLLTMNPSHSPPSLAPLCGLE
jgi:hypothetical protein